MHDHTSKLSFIFLLDLWGTYVIWHPVLGFFFLLTLYMIYGQIKNCLHAKYLVLVKN